MGDYLATGVIGVKLGLMTDSLGHLAFDDLLATARDLGLDTLEFSTGNWGSAPHLDLRTMLASEDRRLEFLSKIAAHGLRISALNCSGNQLAPGEEGELHDRVVRQTVELAGLMQVDRVVLMSGLPAAPGDTYPNWVTVAWPPETKRVLDYQWSDVAIPYWRDLVSFAREREVRMLCIEPHAHQLVYNTETALRLRDEVGETVGVNFDPSHMMWMGADPLSAMKSLAGAIYHVHAKDTRIDRENSARNSLIETKPVDQVAARSWNYVTLGHGHPEEFWQEFVSLLARVGYDDVLSIEHEDLSLPPLEGVRRSVELLDRLVREQ